MQPQSRLSGAPRRATPFRAPWRAATALLAALALVSCSGDDGAPGRNGSSGSRRQIPLARGEALPGFVVDVLGLSGGSGPTGNFRVGDRISMRFTVKTRDGQAIPKEDWDRLRVYISGPTFNYQRVMESTDVLDDVAENAAGEWVYRFPPLPSAYLEPLNYTGAFTDGVLAGQALLSGTYTIGIEGRWVLRDENGAEITDTGNVVEHFLFGDATEFEGRDVVGEQNCFQCHVELRAHGDNRKNLEGCLLCHTAGAEDGNDPNVADGTPGVSIDFRIMIHRIHTGASLPSVLGMTTGTDGLRDYDVDPKPYVVMGFRSRLIDFSHVKFPLWPNFAQPMPADIGHSMLSDDAKAKEVAQRSGPVQCSVCHGDPDGAGPIEAPANGDLIYAQPSIDACMSCHDDWIHDRPYLANGQGMPPNLGNESCRTCHPPSGNPLAVREGHQHPLLDATFAEGVVVDIASVSEAGAGANMNGSVDPGEKIALEVAVTNAAGDPIDASALARFELTISGPTANPQTVHLFALPVSLFGGSQPYRFNVPEKLWLERVGASTTTTGERFPGTLRAPHWDVPGALTVVQVVDGIDDTSALTEAAHATQNYVDIPPAGVGTNAFLRNTYVRLSPGTMSEEYLRIQWVEDLGTARRLWFSAINASGYPAVLRHEHGLGATIEALDVSTKTRGTDYELDPLTGEVLERTEFGDGSDVLVTYVADYVLPDVYQGALNDSPNFDASHGDWGGLPIVAGTYTVNISMERSLTWLAYNTEPTSYIDGSASAVAPFLVAGATEIELQQRLDVPVGCIACHGDLQFHGNHRRGYDVCAQCHTQAGAEDRPQYVAPGSAPNRTLIDFRSMAHKIHAGAGLSRDYVVNGFSLDPYPDNFTAHTYDEVEYPVFAGGVANCASCHGVDNDAWKEPANRDHPTATAAAPTREWLVACTSCHDSEATEAHADVNTSAAGFESCATCHGPGRDLSVERVHFVR
ncbi:MAG: hypothetical protein IPM29_12320 [Planctomycetes bacterium]|nr:hypothetical protein [Planctomycetota bacterium]